MRFSHLASLAWRESRFARKRLFLFLSAISLGVAALVAVQGFASNLQREVRNQARAMLGADVRLMAREPFLAGTEEVLDSVTGAGVQVARVTSFASMALNPASGGSRLVQVRAPEPGFPFYGAIETDPAGRWSTLHEGRNLIVDPALLVAIGAEVGDSISIGAARFEIIATLQKIPGDVEVASSFAPRVFFPAEAVVDTELLGFGARVEYEAFLRIPDPLAAESFVEGNRDLWRAERVRARTVEEQQERMEEALGNLSDFLGMVGVFALLLGGIGVASAMGAYMARKADSVAVLRCIGATAGQVLAIYVLQAAVMGLAGAGVGVVLGAAVQWALPQFLTGLLPVDVQISLDGTAVVTGLVVGVWTAVAFAILPLLQVRRVSPLMALRRRVDPIRLEGADPLRWIAMAGLAGSVLLLIVLQVNRLFVGLGIALGIGGTLLVLWGAAHAAAALLRRSPRSALAFPVRQGIASLHRPGNQTVTVVLALGFGVFLIATLLLTQGNLLRTLTIDADTRGNVLLFDVQQDQVADVEAILARNGADIVQSGPIIPMRVAAVNGVAVRRDPTAMAELERELELEREMEMEPGGEDAEADGTSPPPRGWAVRREYRSTYRDTLTSSETLVAGEWWADDGTAEDGVYGVSLEQDVANDLGVGIGDRIDWDIQGVVVPTRVTSLRLVDWARLEPNFFAVFEPAALLNAPQMWVFMARSEDATQRSVAQRDLVVNHPNISVIDLTLVQRALDDVIGRVSLVIRFLAGFSVATGFIVLLGAVSAGRSQRIRESVLLKTLGATRRQIGAILFTEYALLGLLAVVVGISLASAAGWGLARFLFNVPFGIDALPLLILGGTIALLSAVIGLSASREVFRSTPMEAIREE